MNVFDRISERWYRFRVRRLLRARGEAPAWFVIAMLVMQTVHVGALASCAARQARSTIAETQRDCDRAYDQATTDAEVQAIHARCDAQYEGVRRGE